MAKTNCMIGVIVIEEFYHGIPLLVPRILDNPFQIRKPRGEILPKTTGRERGNKAALAGTFCGTLISQLLPLLVARCPSQRGADVHAWHEDRIHRRTDIGS
jgi:hypothetical protein